MAGQRGFCIVATWGASARLPLRPVTEPKQQSDRRLTVGAWVPRVRDSRTAAWDIGGLREVAEIRALPGRIVADRRDHLPM